MYNPPTMFVLWVTHDGPAGLAGGPLVEAKGLLGASSAKVATCK